MLAGWDWEAGVLRILAPYDVVEVRTGQGQLVQSSLQINQGEPYISISATRSPWQGALLSDRFNREIREDRGIRQSLSA